MARHNVDIQSIFEWILRYVHSSGKKANMRAEHYANQLFNSVFYLLRVPIISFMMPLIAQSESVLIQSLCCAKNSVLLLLLNKIKGVEQGP